MHLAHYDPLERYGQKNSDGNVYFRLSILVIVSLVFHSALFLGIKYDNGPEPVIETALDMVLVDVAKVKPIVKPTVVEKTNKPAIQHRKKIPKNIAKQKAHAIKPVEIEDQHPQIDIPLNTQPSALSPKPQLQQPKPLSKEEVKPTGTELINRAIKFVHTQPDSEKTLQIFNPLTRNLKNDPLNLKISPEKITGMSSHIGSDGRTKVTFTSLDGKVICAEIREDDPLDAFDYGLWYMLPNGCSK